MYIHISAMTCALPYYYAYGFVAFSPSCWLFTYIVYVYVYIYIYVHVMSYYTMLEYMIITCYGCIYYLSLYTYIYIYICFSAMTCALPYYYAYGFVAFSPSCWLFTCIMYVYVYIYIYIYIHIHKYTNMNIDNTNDITLIMI